MRSILGEDVAAEEFTLTDYAVAVADLPVRHPVKQRGYVGVVDGHKARSMGRRDHLRFDARMSATLD